MTNEIPKYVVPELIANGKAFALISKQKDGRKELYSIVKSILMIEYGDTTYKKYFLYPDTKRVGIPKNQNFEKVCAAIKFALTEVLEKLVHEKEQKLEAEFIRYHSRTDGDRLILHNTREILIPYFDKIRQNGKETSGSENITELPELQPVPCHSEVLEQTSIV